MPALLFELNESMLYAVTFSLFYLNQYFLSAIWSPRIVLSFIEY